MKASHNDVSSVEACINLRESHGFLIVGGILQSLGEGFTRVCFNQMPEDGPLYETYANDRFYVTYYLNDAGRDTLCVSWIDRATDQANHHSELLVLVRQIAYMLGGGTNLHLRDHVFAPELRSSAPPVSESVEAGTDLAATEPADAATESADTATAVVATAPAAPGDAMAALEREATDIDLATTEDVAPATPAAAPETGGTDALAGESGTAGTDTSAAAPETGEIDAVAGAPGSAEVLTPATAPETNGTGRTDSQAGTDDDRLTVEERGDHGTDTS